MNGEKVDHGIFARLSFLLSWPTVDRLVFTDRVCTFSGML